MTAVDMGGHEIARRMWVQYSHEADGVVYIVDTCDRERFMEAALELHKLLATSALPPNSPVLILGNKGDLPHAASQEELYWGLGLDELFKKACSSPYPNTPFLYRQHFPEYGVASCGGAWHGLMLWWRWGVVSAHRLSLLCMRARV